MDMLCDNPSICKLSSDNVTFAYTCVERMRLASYMPVLLVTYLQPVHLEGCGQPR